MNNIGVKDLIAIKDNEICKFVEIFIKSSLNIKQAIINSVKCDQKSCDGYMLNILRDTYTCNLLLGYVGMMTLISDNENWIEADKKLTEYIIDFYDDKKFGKKVNEIHQYYVSNGIGKDYCKFLEKMIIKTSVSRKKINIAIKTVETNIYNMLDVYPLLKIASHHLNEIPRNFAIVENKVTLSLDQDNYYQLLDHIPNITTRHQIEGQYMSRTNKLMNDFSKLIVLRKLLANENECSTYFKYINQGKFDNSETIKDLISNLNKKTEAKCKEEVNKIYKYFNKGSNTLITQSDVIYYNRIHKNKTKFNPTVVLNIILSTLSTYFDLSFNEVKIAHDKWNPQMSIYHILDKKTKIVLGKLYHDIFYTDCKKINVPLAIKLSDKMQISSLNSPINDICSVPEVAVIGNYLPGESMTYSDVVLLFREFGYVLQNISYNSKVGLVNYDDEFSNFIPQLMEYIAWDRETIKSLIVTSKKDTAIMDHIEMGRYFDMCISLKLRCINAKFDHLIHNSEPLLNILSDIARDQGDMSHVLLKIYKDIYSEIMDPIKSMMSNTIDNIDPFTIVQEINNSQGVLYSNLVNEIFAYSAFWIIKNNANNDFREKVLSDAIESYRLLVRDFIKTYNINSFDIYVKNVLKVQSIEDMTSEATNYFDDRQSDSHSDQDDIISISRNVSYIPKTKSNSTDNKIDDKIYKKF